MNCFIIFYVAYKNIFSMNGGTAEEAQVGSFEMQIQDFKTLIDNTPNYELVEIYTDERTK